MIYRLNISVKCIVLVLCFLTWGTSFGAESTNKPLDCGADKDLVQFAKFLTGESKDSGLKIDLDTIGISNLVFVKHGLSVETDRLERLSSYTSNEVKVFTIQIDGSTKLDRVEKIDRNEFLCRVKFVQDYVVKNKTCAVRIPKSSWNWCLKQSIAVGFPEIVFNWAWRS